MADLDPVHVEAVAGAMVEVAYHDIAVEFSLTFLPTGDNRASVPPHWEGDAMVRAEHYARALLESTDPDVHAALLAALVQAGELREERGDYGWPPRHQRRYVTRWEAQP